MYNRTKNELRNIMKYIVVLILMPFLIISCKEKKEIENMKINDEAVSMNQITTNYDTLIKRVKNDGNEDAYYELFYGFKDSNEAKRTDSLMIYSKIMAEKHNYERAYFDYFEAFGEKNDIKIDFADYSKIDISKLDENTKKEATDWLKKMIKAKIITIEEYDSIKK